MLSPLATLLFTWTALYAVIAVYYFLLYVRRRSHPEYGAYAATCLALGVWSFGAALGVDAADPSATTRAIQVQYAGGFMAGLFFFEFVGHLTKTAATTVRLASLAVCALGLVLDLGGWLLEPASATTGEPSFTVVGALITFSVTGFSAFAVLQLARASRATRDLRPFVWTSGLTVLVALGDNLLQLEGRSYHALEHVALLPVVTISAVLQLRFLRAARELGDRSEELRKSYSELRLVQHELVRKEQLAAVGELSAVIAHEVRNPLAIIKNAVSGLRRESLRAEDRVTLLSILDEEVDRLGRLVRDLLAYARPLVPRERPMDVGALARDAIDAELDKHEAGPRIEVDLELEEVAPIAGDPELLRQALSNVVANAAQAMPEGGRLRVRGHDDLEGGQSVLVLELADDGPGMPADVLDKARDPFFTTRASGTGLGLAIVERVVRNHRGRVAIESEPGVGTVVKLVIPRSEERT